MELVRGAAATGLTTTSPETSPASPPPAIVAQSSTPTYLQTTSSFVNNGSAVRASPAERAAAKRAQAERSLTTELAPKPVRRAASKKKTKKEPGPSLKDKGWNIKTAFAKATMGVSLAKMFAPKIDLGVRNRVRVGVRFRPMSALEERRGERLDKADGFLQLEEVTVCAVR